MDIPPRQRGDTLTPAVEESTRNRPNSVGGSGALSYLEDILDVVWDSLVHENSIVGATTWALVKLDAGRMQIGLALLS